MAVTLHASGTQSATVTTEHSLGTAAVAGVFQLIVDVSGLLDNDVLVLRIKQKVLTGGTARVMWSETYYGAQSAEAYIVPSIPVLNDLVEAGALDFTLQQTFGTSRDFPWKVVKA